MPRPRHERVGLPIRLSEADYVADRLGQADAAPAMDTNQVAWVNLDGATPDQMVEQKRFMQQMTAIMFILAAVVLLSAVVVPKPDTSDRPWDVGLAVALLAWGIAFPFLRRPPVWLFKA